MYRNSKFSNIAPRSERLTRYDGLTRYDDSGLDELNINVRGIDKAIAQKKNRPVDALTMKWRHGGQRDDL